MTVRGRSAARTSQGRGVCSRVHRRPLTGSTAGITPVLQKARVKWGKKWKEKRLRLGTPNWRKTPGSECYWCREFCPHVRLRGVRLRRAGVSEVPRFSCMKFLDVPWGLRLRRTEQELALSLLSMLPSAHVNRVGVRVVCFRSSMSHPAYPLSTLHWVPRGSSARLEAKWFATPFL